MNPDRIDELIAMAAVGELSAEEEAELDELLESDPGAVADLRATLDTAAAIQADLAESPPPELRARVMAATAGAEQLPAAPTAPAPPAPSGVVSLTARRRRRWSFVATAAAAVVLIVGAAVIVSDRRAGEDPVAEVVEAPDATVQSLSGELGDLRVIFSPSERALVVDGVGVRRPSGTNTFELWLVGESGAIPVGLFRPDDEGRVERRFDDVDITGFTLGVTEEPAGGSDQPTLPILASA